MENVLYADVILPLAVEESYTYSVPSQFACDIAQGVRVVVPLGRQKYYSGIVKRIHGEKPDYKNIKAIVSVTDKTSIVSGIQIRFWEWLAEYYMCSLGEIMTAAIPKALKAQGYNEEIHDRYKPKTERLIIATPELTSDEEARENAFKTLKRAHRQAQILSEAIEKGTIPRSTYKEKDYGALKSLEKKGYIVFSDVKVSRIDITQNQVKQIPELTEKQSEALGDIKKNFINSKPVLLHGITGSGKTEVYINLIDETLSYGKDALYMLPEIAITTQLIERLKNYFGNRMVVYHSKFSDNVRAECYLSVNKRDRKPLLILGVRSSLLLPHNNLGLIIIDEEHENSYKQADPAPRYHARDSAIILAKLSGANVILGSATPSIESYYNSTTGKYGLVSLTERYGGASLPRIIISDTIRSAKRGEKISHFTKQTLDSISQAVSSGRQVILFQNRRGFSPYIECADCNSSFICPDCNVSMTYHKSSNSLVCHYCGHNIPTPSRCGSCGSTDLKAMGFGTEKIEEELQNLLPETSIARLDLDSTRGTKNYNRIISDFEKGKTDIMVGTQMVTKGFDFGNVSLVGILNADNMLNFPDFRASERSFQLMTQVAGRAGRRGEQGMVIIQTSQPQNNVVRQVLAADYESMYRTQIAERHRFMYPPFCRLIKFTLKHRDKQMLSTASTEFNRQMRHVFGKRLLGPEIPAVDKIRGEYLCGFLLKIEKDKSFAEAKKLVKSIIKNINSTKGYASLIVTADVDPQ